MTKRRSRFDSWHKIGHLCSVTVAHKRESDIQKGSSTLPFFLAFKIYYGFRPSINTNKTYICEMLKILIMGLPGSGKTTLASDLKKYILKTDPSKSVTWLNADEVRLLFNDWDFSYEGRMRQSSRMLDLANSSNCNYVICDFVAPLPEMRTNFNPDIVVWVDTIKLGRFEDTNKIFVPPTDYSFRVLEKNSAKWAEDIGSYILNLKK